MNTTELNTQIPPNAVKNTISTVKPEMAISAEPMMGPSENPKPTHFKGETLTQAHLVERHQ